MRVGTTVSLGPCWSHLKTSCGMWEQLLLRQSPSSWDGLCEVGEFSVLFDVDSLDHFNFDVRWSTVRSTSVLCGALQAAECILQHCLQLKQEEDAQTRVTQALETHCFKILLASGVDTNIDNVSGNASLYFLAGRDSKLFLSVSRSCWFIPCSAIFHPQIHQNN